MNAATTTLAGAAPNARNQTRPTAPGGIGTRLGEMGIILVTTALLLYILSRWFFRKCSGRDAEDA
jgi:hypothetical protein